MWELVTIVALAVAFSYGLRRALLGAQGVRLRTAIGLFLAAAVLAFPARLLVAYVLDSFGWSLRSSATVTTLSAWLSTVFVVAALEHLVLLVVISPIYRSHHLERWGTALSAAGFAAIGYATANAIFGAVATPNAIRALGAVSGVITSTFCAGIWASCLPLSHVRYRHWFPFAWVIAVLLDGTIHFLVFAQRGGLQVIGVSVVGAMACGIIFVFRRLHGPRASAVFVPAHRFSLHVDAHRLETVRAAFQHAHRPALVHWIVGGAFVSFGASLLGLGAGVFLSRVFSIDLSRVDETNTNAFIPLLLLGGCVLLSFPISGYLTAKASSADSLFEPGLAALISVLSLAVLLVRSAPVTLVLCIAIAPIAFTLACLGAWAGLKRKV
jgi:hypothetical protein